MKKISFLLFLFSSLNINAQNAISKEINSRLVNLHDVGSNDENFTGYEEIKNAIGDAQIVMLGEQSHTDATTFETKIKLIKYLHQEMDFEILAFESSIYDCDRAWSMIENEHDVRDALAKAINSIWSVLEEFNPLYKYVEQQLEREKPLIFAGFDTQLNSKLAADYFEEDLSSYLATFKNVPSYQKEIKQLQLFINKSRSFKKIKNKKALQNIAFLKEIIALIKNNQKNELSSFWVQSLESLIIFISDTNLKTDDRDQQMARNLIWLKEKYPNKKIICWGATSHFLYNSSLIKMENKKLQKVGDDYYRNHSMMGDYLKEKYGDNIYTIGFIAHEGTFGFNRTRIIEKPSKNNLEYIIGESSKDNYFLPLKNLSLEGYLSRPLAHQNMITDIAQVMDGVVFNRYMRRPYKDWELLFYITPENKMSARKKERFIQEYRIEKQKRKLKQN